MQGASRSGFGGLRFVKWGHFPQLVDPQVVEATRFNPKGVPLHRGESWSTHFLYYLSEVSHVPQWLSFPLKQPLLHVL